MPHRCCHCFPHRSFQYQCHPVTDHYVHHHIEYGGQKRLPLRHTSISAKELYVVKPPRPRYHLNSFPIPAEEAEGPVPHTIFLQDVQAPGPVKCIVCLVQVQGYHMEDCLPHVHNLLKQFDLKGGSTRTATLPKPMEGFMVGDGGGEAEIENHRHRLPHHLHETYSTVVTSPFQE